MGLCNLYMWHVWGRSEMRAEVWWGNLKETHHVEDIVLDG